MSIRKVKLLSTLALTLSSTWVLADSGPHWSYQGANGPSHWAELDDHFKECKQGHAQSPIQIKTSKVRMADLPDLKLNYKDSPAEVVNNGHTIQVNLSDAGQATFASGTYKLVQFHFHTPSEEVFNGKHYPLVAHLVHKDAEGHLAVLAVLFKQGRENLALKEVFEHLPMHEGEQEKMDHTLDLSSLLPKSHQYYAFEGSLTTPPCSEGVAWQILKTPVEVSKTQLQEFQKRFAMNARPVQPLGHRTVRLSKHS